MHRRCSCVFSAFFLYGVCAFGQMEDLPFDPINVVRQVSPSRTATFTHTGEFLVDTTLGYGPATNSQEYPSVAFDGNNYLVVWQDRRSGCDIYGARVNRAGTLLDVCGIIISRASNSQMLPSVAFGGANYLIVWQDYRVDPDGDVYGARVSTAGVVLDTAGIMISNAVRGQGEPEVAFDSTNYFVVWNDWRSGSGSNYDVYGARVTGDGAVLDPGGFAVTTATGSQVFPAVAFGGVNYLVTWHDERNGSGWDIYGARVSPAGAVLDVAGIPVSRATATQMYPSVASNGTGFLVAWQDYRIDPSADLYGARVSGAGVVLDTGGIMISNAVRGQGEPVVSFEGTNYLVVWNDWRVGEFDIYGSRVDPNGVVLDSSGIPISTYANYQGFPAIARGDTSYLVVWRDDRSGMDIYGARVSRTGTVHDPQGILVSKSFAIFNQGQPSVVSDGVDYLVSWKDDRIDGDIYAARVSQTGSILDRAPFGVTNAPGRQSWPSAAFDGTNYLIAWQDERSGSDIYGARVSRAGVLLDTNGISISRATGTQSVPSIAFGGACYLVVWQDFRYDPTGDLYGARVDLSGAVLDTAGIAISRSANGQGEPDIAFDGSNFVVVWHDGRSGTSNYDIYGCRVTPGGVVIDQLGIAVTTAQSNQTIPAIAFGAGNYLAVWQDGRSGSNWDVYGARISPGGLIQDTAGIALSVASDAQEYPSAAFDGSRYFVTWQDRRSASSYDIHAARVTSSGSVLDPTAITVQPGNQVNPKAAHGTGQDILVAYSGWCDSVNGRPCGTMRIWGILNPVLGVGSSTNVERYPRPDLRVYPNPFLGRTKIIVRTPGLTSSAMSLRVYNSAGRLVRHLGGSGDGERMSVIWDGLDERGRRVSAGVYFIQLIQGPAVTAQAIVKLE